MQGLAQNLKNLGDGKAWIVGTAQQTLTEDDPRAALNSPLLYKLKDRFPIQIDLEARDIKEICYRRLLGKSADGEKELGQLFDRQGQALRHNTKLQDAKYYDADSNKETFTNLYPFLPAHFDILLHLLGALAKSTGGIGLRSAIKVIQDILVEGGDGQTPVANQPVGWLATTVTLYDSLEKDIRRAFPSIHQAVDKTLIRFPDAELHREIAKTVAVLQILGNLPVTVENVASLMHPAVDAPSRMEAVKAAVDELLKDPLVPLGEKDQFLHFYSEKLNDIEQERAQITLRTPDMRRIFNEALRDVFSPLPSARLHGTLAVTSGLKAQSGAQQVSLAGEREAIQTVVEFVDPSDYDTQRTRLLEESRHRTSESTIYLLGRRSPEADDLVREIYRSQRIVELHRNDPDQEVRDYCTSQSERAGRLLVDLQQQLRRSLAQGSFLFRGQTTAIHAVDQELLGACKKHLAQVAGQVFDRYTEAPERAETALAEKFLRTGNLAAMTSQLDPLGLVQITAGKASIGSDHKALVSIRDYIDRNGTVEGRRLAEQFGGPPFGWSQDTLRYLIAALLVSGEIKLKVSGREVTVNGQQAIDGLKTNTSFRSVGVALRHDRPSMELLARAAERMTDLIGDTVVPLEAEISRAAGKHLPKFSSQFAPLAESLDRLYLPGGDKVRTAIGQIDDLLISDASDAPQRLGAEESALYAGLKWARSAKQALDRGLAETIATLRRHQQAIRGFPKSGVPGVLREDVEEDLVRIDGMLRREDFFEHAADLATTLTSLQGRVAKAVADMADAQKQRIREAEEDLKRIPEWSELTQEEQNTALARLDDLLLVVEPDLSGLEQLITHEFDIQMNVADAKRRIEQEGRQRRHQRIEEQRRHAAGAEAGKRKYTRSIPLPERVSTTAQLDGLVRDLRTVQADVAFYDEFELTFTR
jgi:hypothetical protein